LVSLFIFWGGRGLDDPSIDENGILKSSTTIVLESVYFGKGMPSAAKWTLKELAADGWLLTMFFFIVRQ
jgi:hypothetical protein